MEKTYSNEIANAVHRFLVEDDWNFEFREERGIFRFGLNRVGKFRKVHFVVDIHDSDFNVYGLCPILVDQDDREVMGRMAEFLNRANYGLRCGNFEMDYRDGEIRYKTYVECEGLTEPSAEMVRNGIYCVASIFKRYSDGILKIMYTDMDPEDAVAYCEMEGMSDNDEGEAEEQTAESEVALDGRAPNLRRRFGEMRRDESENTGR